MSDAKEDPRAEDLYREADRHVGRNSAASHRQGVHELRRRPACRGIHSPRAICKERLGKRSESEASLKKAIDYGQRSVDLEPARPLAKHNLDVARRMLEGLREQAFEEEINKLEPAPNASRTPSTSSREESRNRMNGSVPARALRRPCPAWLYRLNRLAWLLAHCPDRRAPQRQGRDRARRRATSLRSDVGDYWYTLAMAQYRHGDWRDSLVSLDTLKAKQGDV